MVESAALNDRLATSFAKLRRSPVRWVVLFHAIVLVAVIALKSFFPQSAVLAWLDVSVVLAQITLLLIWTGLNGEGIARRLTWSAFALGIGFVAHAPVSEMIAAFCGLICFVPALYALLTIPAIPFLFAQSKGMQLLRFDAHDMPPAQRMQFSVRDVFVVSAGAALLFSSNNALGMLEDSPESIILGIVTTFGLFLVTVVLFTLLLTIPLVSAWVALTPGDVLPRLAASLVGWGLGGLLMFQCLHRVDGDRFKAFFLACVAASAIVILLATLFVLRRMGYRAVWADYGKRPLGVISSRRL